MNRGICFGLATIVLSQRRWRSQQTEPHPFTARRQLGTGFDRYDFLMDEASLTLKPIKAAADEKNGIKGQVKGQFRCIVVVPKEAAPGNPWSWRGCYWDHEPQTEVELLNARVSYRFVMSDPGKPGMPGTLFLPRSMDYRETGLHRHEPWRSQRIHVGHSQP